MAVVLESVFHKVYGWVKAIFAEVVNWVYEKWIDLDLRHRIRDDWYIIPYFVRSVLLYGYLVVSGRLNYWYIFERQALKPENRDRQALVYISGVVDKTKGPVDGNFQVERYTYSEVYGIVLRLSYVLANEHGVKPGDVVGIAIRNKPIFVFYWFALWNLGAKPAFLNYNVNSGPLAHSVKVSGMSQVFVDEETKQSIYYEGATPSETYRLVRAENPLLAFSFIDEARVKSRIVDNPQGLQFRLPDRLRNRQDHAWSAGCYIFTSGTTGLPKAAIMSWRKIDLGTALYGRIVRISSRSTVFTAMPLYHSTAAILGLLPTVSQGGCIAITDKFSASSFWGQVRVTGATHIQYVGEMCRYLLSRPADAAYEHSHRATVAYGNGLRLEIWNEFRSRFNIKAIGEFFASTEAPIATTSFQYGDYGVGACRNYGTIINYILSFQQRLAKMDGDDLYRDPVTGLGAEPSVGEPGQLLFRITRPKKPYVDFQGYVNDLHSTADKIVHSVFKKGDCWMKTGDLLKQDANGLLYFLDRLGDTYRWKSENVSTNEVEIQLVKSGLFENCIVVGVKLQGYEGRAGYAVGKLKPSASQIGHVLTELSLFLKRNLPKYSIPVFLKLVDNYKTTDTHKIIKNYYKNQVFPHGRDKNETIYWFDGNSYQELTDTVWKDILSGKIRL